MRLFPRMNHALLLFAALVLVQCTEFHAALSANGKPPSNQRDTIQDTLVIPSDTLLLDTLFPYLDTLFTGNIVARNTRIAELQFRTENTMDLDSLFFLGTLLSDDSLDLKLRVGTNAFQVLPGISISHQGLRLRHTFRAPLGAARSYTLRWQFSDDAADVGVLFAVGFRADSAFDGNVAGNISLVHYTSLSPQRSRFLEPGWGWERIAVLPGDSVIASIDTSAGLHAFLTDESSYQTFTGGVFTLSPEDAIYASRRDGDSLRMQLDAGGTYYWFVHNPSGDTLNLVDTLWAGQFLN